MAKGDGDRMQGQIDKQRTSQDALTPHLYSSQGGFQNSYNTATGQNFGSYDDIMNKYNSLYNNPFGDAQGQGGLGGGGGGGMPGYGEQRGIYSDLANNGGGYGWDPMFRGAMGNAIGGFNNFAQTGGFSDQNIQDMRARAMSPVRAAYGNAENELQRSRSLGGGSPNFAAAQSRMAREQGYGMSDAQTNMNAQLAQMIQQGKLSGLQGLSATGTAGQGLSTDIDSLNAQMKLAGLQGMMGVDDRLGAQSSAAGARSDQNAKDQFNARMGVLGGMNDMYGTTPGLLHTTGNQLLGANDQLLQSQGVGNQLMDAQYNRSLIPGDFQQAMGNVGSVVDLAGRIGGAATGIGGLGGGNIGGGGVPMGTPRYQNDVYGLGRQY